MKGNLKRSYFTIRWYLLFMHLEAVWKHHYCGGGACLIFMAYLQFILGLLLHTFKRRFSCEHLGVDGA